MFSGVSSAIGLLAGVDAALARDGQGAGEVTLGGAQPGGVLQLARGVLEAQTEQVLADRLDAVAQLVVLKIAQLLGRDGHQASSRMTNFVRTGSLWPARRMAS